MVMELPRFKLWHLMVAIAVFPLCAPILALVASSAYVACYLDSCMRRAERASLRGRPEAVIVRVLGPPSGVNDHDDPSGRKKTYVYDPGGLPPSVFEVHCQNGIVKGYWVDD